MCGFAGFVGPVQSGTEVELERMGDAIRHRGPDSAGLWHDADAGVALVHRRLAVVELSPAGHQPMVSASGRWVLAFNGEVYNHLALRDALAAREAAPLWRGGSDTETLLATIETDGTTAAVSSWVGMFAFALWDRERGELTLGRDRFGEKPLYYGRHRGRWLFGSELGALRASDGFDARFDRAALAAYFRHHYVPAPMSIYEGIGKLEPGTLVRLQRHGDAQVERYWSAHTAAAAAACAPFDGNRDEARAALDAALSRAVAGQMVADVPVGAFLSGGIDSSAVVATMVEQASGAVRTYSIGFDDPRYDESAHARRVAAHLGTEHTELRLDGVQAATRVAALPGAHDEPFADASALPMRAVAELARTDVTVCLSGDGGDELFGGYTRYAHAARALAVRERVGSLARTAARALLATPLLVRGLTGEARIAVPVGSAGRRRAAGRAVQVLAEQSDAGAYRDLVSYWHGDTTPVLGAVESAARFLDPALWPACTSTSEAMPMMDLVHYLPDDILVKVDRAAMGVSLETRVPLLDHRIAEFLWTLPPAWRVATDPPKRLLREIAWQRVPRDLLERPKTGFGIPVADWLRGPLREWAESLLVRADLVTDGLLDVAQVLALWQAFIAGDDALAEPVWGVLCWRGWQRANAA